MRLLTAVHALYRLLGPARPLFWASVVAAAITALWSAVTFLSAAAVAQQVAMRTGAAWPAFAGDSVLGRAADVLNAVHPDRRILLGVVATATSMLVGNLIGFVTLVVSTRFLARFLVHLQTTCFEGMLDARLGFHDETRRSELNQLVIVEVRSCYNVMKAVTTLTANGLQAVVPVAVMLLVSVPLTIAFLAVGLGAWAITARLNRLAKRWSQMALANRNELMAVTQDALYGIKPLKLLSHCAAPFQQFAATSTRSTRLFARVGILVNGQTTIVSTLGMVAVSAAVMASVALPERLPPLSVALFLFVAVGLLGPAGAAAREVGVMHESLPAVDSVTTFLRTVPGVRERDGQVERGVLVRDRIVFEDVHLEYEHRPGILRGVSLVVERGECLGIVGPSGSGKTSLVNLLPRLYDPSRGRITVDGTDLRDFRLAFLRRRIGLLSQDVFIFNGTVRDNILMGRADAADEDIVTAARMANAHDFITALPQGYDTVVGDRGVKLSGGQRQRVAIAQVFLKDPEILVLDEATSALDSESEALVQDAIARLTANRTVVVIAHRLSTLRSAHRIVVLNDGVVVEQGTWSDLVERGGVFARLWDLQTHAIG